MDSGRRALQFLGLDEEKSSVGFDVSKISVFFFFGGGGGVGVLFFS